MVSVIAGSSTAVRTSPPFTKDQLHVTLCADTLLFQKEANSGRNFSPASPRTPSSRSLSFISPRHHLRLPQPRLKESLFGQGPSPTRSPVSASVHFNHLIIDRRSSWALVSHTRKGVLARTHSLTEPAFLITPKTLIHGGLIHPFLSLSSFQLHSMLSQCTKESREEVLRFPASLW